MISFVDLRPPHHPTTKAGTALYNRPCITLHPQSRNRKRDRPSPSPFLRCSMKRLFFYSSIPQVCRLHYLDTSAIVPRHLCIFFPRGRMRGSSHSTYVSIAARILSVACMPPLPIGINSWYTFGWYRCWTETTMEDTAEQKLREFLWGGNKLHAD